MVERTGADHRRIASQSIELDHAPALVWQLFTHPDHVEHWLGSGAVIDVRPGGEVATPDPVSGRPKRGRVDRVDDGRSIELTWWDDMGGDGDASIVRFDLVPSGDGTRLTVTETAAPRSGWPSGGGLRARASAGSSAAGDMLWAWRLALVALAATGTRAVTAQPIR